MWLAVEATHELAAHKTSTIKREGMGIHDCTNLEIVSGKTLVTMGISGKERKGVSSEKWLMLFINLLVSNVKFKVAPKKITFFPLHQSLNMLKEPVQKRFSSEVT